MWADSAEELQGEVAEGGVYKLTHLVQGYKKR